MTSDPHYHEQGNRTKTVEFARLLDKNGFIFPGLQEKQEMIVEGFLTVYQHKSIRISSNFFFFLIFSRHKGILKAQ